MAAAAFAFVIAVLVGTALASSPGRGGMPHDVRPADEDSTLNDICNGRPCPSYKVLTNLSQDMEEREYQAMELPAYTATQCLSFNGAKTQGYFHLHMYAMAGQNVAKSRLQMGVPVIMEAKHVEDVEPRCSWLYTTLFYVNELQLPAPVDTNITIKSFTALRFYVLSFGGYHGNIEDSVLSLRIRLNARKLCYDPSTYYVAAYQSPKANVNRRNEIWMPVRPCTSPASVPEQEENLE